MEADKIIAVPFSLTAYSQHGQEPRVIPCTLTPAAIVPVLT